MVVDASVDTSSSINDFSPSISYDTTSKDNNVFHQLEPHNLLSSGAAGSIVLKDSIAYNNIDPISGIEKLSTSLIKADIIAQKVSRGDKIKNYRAAKYRTSAKNSDSPNQLHSEISTVELAERAKENAKQLILSLGCESDILPDYDQYLQDVEESLKIVGENMTFPKIRAMWNSSEDHLLTLGVSLYGANTESWPKIAVLVPGRTNKACRKRWFHSLDPTLHKGSWSVEEDNLLRMWVAKHPGQWSKIAKKIQGRTDDQCAKRWRESLDPNISRSKWCPEEDHRLLEKYNEYGAQWQKIAVFFKGRPGLHCRNRWRKIQRRLQQDTEKADFGSDNKPSNTMTQDSSSSFANNTNTSNSQHDSIVPTSAKSIEPTTQHNFGFETTSKQFPSIDGKKRALSDSPINLSSISSFDSHNKISFQPPPPKPNIYNQNHHLVSTYNKDEFSELSRIQPLKSKNRQLPLSSIAPDNFSSSFSFQLGESDMSGNRFGSNTNTSLKKHRRDDPADYFLSQVDIDQLIGSRFNSVNSAPSEIDSRYSGIVANNHSELDYTGNDLSAEKHGLNSSNIAKRRTKQKASKRSRKSDQVSPTINQKEWLYQSGLKLYGCAALPGICDSSFYDSFDLLEHLKNVHSITDTGCYSEFDNDITSSSRWSHVYRCGVSGCSSLYKNVKSLENHIFCSSKSLHYQSYLQDYKPNQSFGHAGILGNSSYSKLDEKAQNNFHLLESVPSLTSNNLSSPHIHLASTHTLFESGNFDHMNGGSFSGKANALRPNILNNTDNVLTNYYLKGHDFLKPDSGQHSQSSSAKASTKNFFDFRIDEYSELHSPMNNITTNSPPTNVNYNPHSNIFTSTSSTTNIMNIESKFFDSLDEARNIQYEFPPYNNRQLSSSYHDGSKLIQAAVDIFNNQNQ